MSTVYCGICKLPKGKRQGTMKECAELGQVRYYGLHKMDPKTLELAHAKGANKAEPETYKNLMMLMFKLKGLINRNKGRYEGAKDEKAKEQYHEIWQASEKKLATVIKKLMKIKKVDDDVGSKPVKKTASTKKVIKLVKPEIKKTIITKKKGFTNWDEDEDDPDYLRHRVDKILNRH